MTLMSKPIPPNFEPGIPEYWIVDSREQRIPYSAAGEFGPGQIAASRLREGFHIDVAQLFSAV